MLRATHICRSLHMFALPRAVCYYKARALNIIECLKRGVYDSQKPRFKHKLMFNARRLRIFILRMYSLISTQATLEDLFLEV